LPLDLHPERGNNAQLAFTLGRVAAGRADEVGEHFARTFGLAQGLVGIGNPV
jgi:hypothetical protein